MSMTSNDNLCQDNPSNDHEESPYCSVCYLNKGEEEEMEIYGYERSKTRTIVTWTCIVLSLGILRLIFHWYQHWMVYCTHRQCPLKYAQRVVVIGRYHGSHITYHVRPVRRVNLEELSSEDVAVVCNDLDMTNVTRLAKEAGSAVRIYFSDGTFTDESDLIEVKVKKLSYVWREDQHQFCKLAGIDKGFNKADLHNLQGYSVKEELLRRIVYGKNEIKVKMNSLCELFMLEFLNPFYIFQVFSLILWFIEVYLYYSFAIIAMSLFGITLTIIQTQRNQKQLANTVQTQGDVTVCRNIGKSKYEAIYEEVPINNLVPGDIIVIPRTGFIIPCDAVLLSGQCIVNESMLTGESVPVTKTSLPCIPVPYTEKEDGNHTLYCGTEILQARYYANEHIHAVVLRTGYMTAKGSLIRSILYPLPHDFQFDRDVNRFVWILGCIAIVGTTYAFITKLLNGYSLFETIIDSLDIITIVVPPALPAALSVGKYYAQDRLQKQKISCMNPAVINVSGSVNCVCFDKTGTLTEDGLDLYGVIPVHEQKLEPLQTNVRDGVRPNLKEAMASCHSLTLINGVTSGDPLDVKMFEATGWILDETEITDTIKYDLLAPTIVKSQSDNQEIGIIHQFQFSSRLQRMSVITRHLNAKHLTVYCKGSPEMIVSLSTRESVPEDLDTVLGRQTEKGYRVIAVGYRNFPVIDIIKLKRLHRDEVECNLTFAGLIIFENKLKPQTTSIIGVLKQARMNIVMLTGDNLQTAVCVARECGIVDPEDTVVHVNITKNNGHVAPKLTFKACQNETSKFVTRSSKIFSIQDIELGLKMSGMKRKYVVSGHEWSTIRESFPQHIKSILQQGAIFARMSPDHKQQVIQELQKMGFYVAMCGDGANDCGALKTADVGISLSEAESSVASPFTSHQPDISCVPKIIKEGRAALVTAVGLFKFMVLYSLLEFFSSVLLFTFNSSLSDMEFLYIDIFLIVVFAFFFGQTRAYSGPLVPKPPSSSLLSVIPLVSVFTQLLLMVAMQILSDNLIKHFPWYSYRDRYPEVHSKQLHSMAEFNTYDNYAVYTTSQFQYIILAITFSVGAPYRQPIYKNVPFFVSLLIMSLVSTYITLFPAEFVRQLFAFRLPPTLQFRCLTISLSIITFVLSITLESFVTNYILAAIISRRRKPNLFTKRYPSEVSEYIVNSSIGYLSEIEVKCYGTMK